MKKVSEKKSSRSEGIRPPRTHKKADLAILHEIMRCGLPDQEADSFISQLLHVMEQRFMEADFTVEQLAKAMAVCPRTLYRRTIFLTSLSASKIIRLYRLHKAVRLLQRGHLVCDAAYAVGFENLSYFTRCFKNEFKICPSHYLISEYNFLCFREGHIIPTC